MTATACNLAVLLLFEAATSPAAKEECELTDNRCKAALYERRSVTVASANHRALYLFNAHKLYLHLFDTSGDMRDLCAARRTIEASLAVDGQPGSLRSQSQALRVDLLAREKQQGARCESVSKRRRVKPVDAPLVAHGLKSPTVPTTDPALPLLTGASANSNSPPSVAGIATTPRLPVSASGRSSQLEPQKNADVATMQQPGEISLLPVNARQVDVPLGARTRLGRGLVIAGGATLGVGVALAVGAGFTARRLSDTRHEIIALSEQADGYATAEEAARDASLRRDNEAQGHQRLALAIGSGAAIVVAMILGGVGGRKMARIASQTSLAPDPGGFVFRLRF